MQQPNLGATLIDDRRAISARALAAFGWEGAGLSGQVQALHRRPDIRLALLVEDRLVLEPEHEAV
jgi:hypothetical protein